MISILPVLKFPHTPPTLKVQSHPAGLAVVFDIKQNRYATLLHKTVCVCIPVHYAIHLI